MTDRPLFQRRHYEAMARRCQMASATYRTYLATFLAGVFKQDNPRFDAERFKRACEPGANVQDRTKGK